jgi:hypothetical protein
VAEGEHKTGGLVPTLGSVLRRDIRGASTDKVGQLRSLGNFMLNHGLDILFLHLPAVLPLNVFCRAATEIIRSVFFRYYVSMPTLGTTGCGGKTLDFCLDVRPSNSVDSIF